MKKLKIILLWTLFALVIESGIFFILENKYFNTDLKVSKVKLVENKKTEEHELTLPESSGEVKVSDSARFISYLEDKSIKIFDSKTGNTNTVKAEDNFDIQYYKWLPGENSFIMAEKSKGSSKAYFDLYSYDAKSNTKRELLNFDMKKLRINSYSPKEVISDIAFSTSTHVMYIKVQKNSNVSDIYMVNIMNELKKVKSDAHNIGRIDIFSEGTDLIYEEKDIVKSLNNNKSVSAFNGVVLLGIDKDKKVYLGKKENNKISKIYYGESSMTKDKWKIFDLPIPTEAKDIFIKKDGLVFVNNSKENNLLELSKNSKIQYNGKLLDISHKELIIIENNKVMKKSLNN
ncbi:hypothetical protein KQI89_00685 [Clostridium sp. MSJ-4]|uniref:Dipeptidyl peptidase IV n=1 Tax=Clostridium simiarum TaxID=2841506 RepID=A0ABS6EXZ9_9CLOT|nr:hypothetical protein [Clostridium simiarum]MBU5590273.1 hypothetical protein [Clostridium simiarum]